MSFGLKLYFSSSKHCIISSWAKILPNLAPQTTLYPDRSNSPEWNQCRLLLCALPDVVWDDDSPQCPSFQAVQNVAHKQVGRSSKPTCGKPKVPLFIHLWCWSVNTPGWLYLAPHPLIMQRLYTGRRRKLVLSDFVTTVYTQSQRDWESHYN